MNAFSALVVTLVDYFGPSYLFLIRAPSANSLYIFYIRALWALWLLIVLDVDGMCVEKEKWWGYALDLD